MFGSVVLDVAIGLSLLFLFVSLICSAIREGIEVLVNMRAADLERGVRELLDDPAGTGPAKALYDHPLIFSLYRGTYHPGELVPHRGLLGEAMGLCMPIRARFHLPAYIPAENFARAFLDLTLRGPVHVAGPGGADPGQAPLILSIETLEVAARQLPPGRVRRALLVALDGAEGDLERVQSNIELWFNACMDRVSGWYKRRTQVILFGIGVLTAGVMNIDAFSVGRALFQDKALRDGAVEQAASLVPHDGGAAVVDAAQQGFAALQSDLDRIQFPTGWEPAPQRLRVPRTKPHGDETTRIDGLAVLQMLIGWTVTGFAVMLGAPFWFDMLNRFTIVRSTIKPGQFGFGPR